MNILPKKRWHVRTKENVARVRRDQKLAAEEEKMIAERALLAEHEFKVSILRKNAEDRMEKIYGVQLQDEKGYNDNLNASTSASGHVNFFAEIEAGERLNLGVNKDYEEEKRKEMEEFQKKVGILQYLGQGSNELTKEKPWYASIVRDAHSKKISTRQKISIVSDSKRSLGEGKEKGTRDIGRHENRDDEYGRHKKKKDKKRKRNRYSSGKSCMPSNDDEEDKEHVKKKLEEMREERLRREAKERERFNAQTKLTSKIDDKQKQMYSAQFNPQIARQNRH